MSGFISKFAVSAVTGKVSQLIAEGIVEQSDSKKIGVVIAVAANTLLCAKDLYDFVKGDIVTVTQKYENGVSVEKKYLHKEMSATKLFSSLVGPAGIGLIALNSFSQPGITTQNFIDKTLGNQLGKVGLCYVVIAAGIELIVDAFDLDIKIEDYQEINGNDFFIVT